jgi:hypothetical protein
MPEGYETEVRGVFCRWNINYRFFFLTKLQMIFRSENVVWSWVAGKNKGNCCCLRPMLSLQELAHIDCHFEFNHPHTGLQSVAPSFENILFCYWMKLHQP